MDDHHAKLPLRPEEIRIEVPCERSDYRDLEQGASVVVRSSGQFGENMCFMIAESGTHFTLDQLKEFIKALQQISEHMEVRDVHGT